MIKKIVLFFAVLAAALSIASVPAQASVPDWDAILANNVAVSGKGWSFLPAQAHANMPESPTLAAKRAASDCAALGFFFCTWKDINYSGQRWAFSDATVNAWPNYSFSFGSSPSGSGGIDNTGSSWVNNLPYSMRLFDDVYCDTILGLPWRRDMAPGQHATAQGSDWNDRVSAIARIIRTDGIDCY